MCVWVGVSVLVFLQVRRENPGLDLPEVVREVLSRIEGAYGVCFLFADQPDILIGARKGSPLILGIGKLGEGSEETKEERAPVVTECFLASDASAIIEYTNKVRCLARIM